MIPPPAVEVTRRNDRRSMCVVFMTPPTLPTLSPRMRSVKRPKQTRRLRCFGSGELATSLGQFLEREPGDHLAGSGRRTGAADQVDKAVTAGDVAGAVVGDRRSGRGDRTGPGPAIEHV